MVLLTPGPSFQVLCTAPSWPHSVAPSWLPASQKFQPDVAGDPAVDSTSYCPGLSAGTCCTCGSAANPTCPILPCPSPPVGNDPQEIQDAPAQTPQSNRIGGQTLLLPREETLDMPTLSLRATSQLGSVGKGRNSMQNPKGSLLGDPLVALWDQSWLKHRTLPKSSRPWQHPEDSAAGKTHLDLPCSWLESEVSPASGKQRGKCHSKRVYINKQRGAASTKHTPQQISNCILPLHLQGKLCAKSFPCSQRVGVLLVPHFAAPSLVQTRGCPKTWISAPDIPPALLQAQGLGSCSTAEAVTLQRCCTPPSLMQDLSSLMPFESHRNELWHLGALCRMGKGAPRDSTAMWELPSQALAAHTSPRAWGWKRLHRESTFLLDWSVPQPGKPFLVARGIFSCLFL